LKEIRWQAEINCAYDKRHAQARDRDRYEQKKNAGVAFMNLHFNQISLSLASMSRALVCTALSGAVLLPWVQAQWEPESKGMSSLSKLQWYIPKCH
jgi:hypothetical protein